MPENTNPHNVQEELARKNENSSVKKLMFDPNTGELIVQKPTEQNTTPNAVVVDQIYKDGFFK